MKKITLIITLLSLWFSYAQEFPIDFSTADDTFTVDNGAQFSLANNPTDNSDQVGKITTTGTSGAYENVQLDLYKYLNLTTGNKTITFDFYSTTTATVLVKFQNSLAGNHAIEMQFTPSGDGWETITLDFNSAVYSWPNTGTVTFDQYSKLVIFPDFGATSTGVYYIDDIAGATNGGIVNPSSVPTAPITRDSNDVISVYSDTYTSVGSVDIDPNWGQATDATQVQIGSEYILKYAGLNYQGLTFAESDVRSMDYVHFDYWTANPNIQLGFYVINSGTGENGYDVDSTLGIITGQWVSVDIPMSHFTITDLSAVDQIKTDGGSGNVYIDNIYFWKDEPTWTGNTDSDWSVAGNWNPAQVPTALADITVPSNATINITGNKTFNSMNVSAGASIISTGTITGSITYTRSIGSTNWYLISSPVGGQDIDTFVAASNLATGGSSNVGFSSFDEANNQWTYYQSGASGTGNFTEGKGHAIKLASTGNISFTGTFNSSDSSISMTDSNKGYNLIGNPYLSSVSVIELINQNSAALEESTVWLWDQSADTYVQKNLAADLEVAPGQGFFVQADNAGTFQITETMQSHSSDTFQRTMSRPEMLLTLNNGEVTRTAEIYYVDGATTGFDNGFDSSIFGSGDNSFAIYTRTVNGDSDNNLGIQSLPTSNYENMVIPVGINAISGTNISVSVSPTSIPDGIEVYLEDTFEETFTLMNDENVYSNVLLSDHEGIGRYYLHTTSDNLGNDNPYNVINNITVFPTERDGIRILNLPSGKTNIKMYDLLGKIILNTSIDGGVSNNVSLPNLTTGIYVVKLMTPVGTKNQKVIIK